MSACLIISKPVGKLQYYDSHVSLMMWKNYYKNYSRINSLKFIVYVTLKLRSQLNKYRKCSESGNFIIKNVSKDDLTNDE